MFNKKKRRRQQLEDTFGDIKTENLNLNLVKRYFERKTDPNALQIVSEQTCDDLDFDLFFSYIDRTQSRIGQQALYAQLRTIKDRKLQFQEQEALIDLFNENRSKRNKTQYELSRLNSRKAYYISDLFQSPPFKKPSWSFIIPILSILITVSIPLAFFSTWFALILMLLLPIHVLIHFALKRSVSVFIDSIPQLLTMSSVANKLVKLNLTETGNNIIASLKTVTSIKRRMSFFKLEQKVDSDMEAAYWFLIEMIKITFLLEPLLMFSAAKKLDHKQRDIETVFDYIAQIDLALSINALRNNVEQYCIPNIIENGNLKATGIHHPLIVNCVSNSIELTNKSFLLTGSNMSGKTTLMRTIGLNHLSSLSLNTAFAEEIKLPCCKIYSMIRVSDDLMESTSYFMKELELVKAFIDDTDKGKKLILLDELFKGTNTSERIASASAVLSYLQHTGNFVFVASHDLELNHVAKCFWLVPVA